MLITCGAVLLLVFSDILSSFIQRAGIILCTSDVFKKLQGAMLLYVEELQFYSASL